MHDRAWLYSAGSADEFRARFRPLLKYRSMPYPDKGKQHGYARIYERAEKAGQVRVYGRIQPLQEQIRAAGLTAVTENNIARGFPGIF